MTKIKQRIRTTVLRRHGLQSVRYGKVEPDTVEDRAPLASPPAANKTLAMRLIEGELQTDIEEVLESGSLSEVAELLGLDKSTISKWRLRLGLR